MSNFNHPQEETLEVNIKCPIAMSQLGNMRNKGLVISGGRKSHFCQRTRLVINLANVAPLSHMVGYIYGTKRARGEVNKGGILVQT